MSRHAVLVLPLLARLLSRTAWSAQVRGRIAAVVAGCYGAAVVTAGIWAAWTY